MLAEVPPRVARMTALRVLSRIGRKTKWKTYLPTRSTSTSSKVYIFRSVCPGIFLRSQNFLIRSNRVLLGTPDCLAVKWVMLLRMCGCLHDAKCHEADIVHWCLLWECDAAAAVFVFLMAQSIQSVEIIGSQALIPNCRAVQAKSLWIHVGLDHNTHPFWPAIDLLL